MPDIEAISIKNICYSHEIKQTKSIIPQSVKQIIRDEFYSQLKKAADLFGKPTFARDVTIYLTKDKRCFNSKDNYIALQDWCIDWSGGNELKWQLQEALSHEITHLIVGKAYGQPYRTPAFVMEEGLAYYNTHKNVGDWIEYDKNVMDAINYIEEAIREIPNLLTIWRHINGEAPVIQMLNQCDLKKWGLGVKLCEKLLEDFSRSNL